MGSLVQGAIAPLHTPTIDISVSNGHAVTTSRSIAKTFGKRHADVLRATNSLRGECPREWYERNFAFIQVSVDLGHGRTRNDPAYEVTRDGFVLLVMGFTGKNALRFKIAYIEQFNEMERRLIAEAQDSTIGVSPAPDGTWAIVIENGVQRMVPLVHLYRQEFDAQGGIVPMGNTKPIARASADPAGLQPCRKKAEVYPNQSKYNPWRAYVQRGNIPYYIGSFPTQEAAEAARDQAYADLAAGREPCVRRLREAACP